MRGDYEAWVFRGIWVCGSVILLIVRLRTVVSFPL